jgi:hypothetical protein
MLATCLRWCRKGLIIVDKSRLHLLTGDMRQVAGESCQFAQETAIRPITYLRRGGSVFHLQKVLGHRSLEMTRRYANLMTANLQAVHERVSLLSRS